MDANILYLFDVLNSILYDKAVPKPPENYDWEPFFLAAGAGEVIGLLYKKLDELEGTERPSEEWMNWLKEMSLKKGFEKLQQYDLYSKILQAAKEQNIQIINFKGVVLANLYPDPMLRSSCDIDFYVSPENLPKMELILQDMGFVKNEEHSKENVPVYVFAKILMLEVHCCLFEDYKGKQIDLLNEMELTKQEDLIKVNAFGLELTTLGYEKHLIFLLFHLIKHISYSGCTIKTILDIVLYINAYHEKIDKEDFWKKMKLLGYDTFCRTLFSINCYYFNMTKEIFIDDSYSEHMAKKMLEQLYETRILKKSLKNLKDDRRASSIAYQSFYDKKATAHGKFGLWTKAVFPGSKDLSFRYMYARKHPSLVGIAWVHRAFNNISARVFRSKEEQVGMTGDMRLAKQKLSLLEEMDLRKE